MTTSSLGSLTPGTNLTIVMWLSSNVNSKWSLIVTFLNSCGVKPPASKARALIKAITKSYNGRQKRGETLGSKIRFLSFLGTFPPPPAPPTCWFFHFFDCTDRNAYTTLNWVAGGIRELMLHANKIEQMFEYRKGSFPKSVWTTFVAHCSLQLYRQH